MTNDEIRRVLDIIRRVPKMGTFRLAFTGGEAFLNRDLVALAAYARKYVAKPEILTNGFLANEHNLRDLKPYIEGLQVSLDYPERLALLHDKRRGKRNAWRHGMDCLEWCYLFEIPRTVAMTVGRHNFKHVAEMLKLSIIVGAELKLLRFIPYVKDDAEYALSPQQNRKLCEFVEDNGLVSDMPIGSLVSGADSRCDAGVNRLAIRIDKRVSPCDFVYQSFGNILRDPLDGIMAKMKVWREKNYGLSRTACGACKNWNNCWGGCPAHNVATGKHKDGGCWA